MCNDNVFLDLKLLVLYWLHIFPLLKKKFLADPVHNRIISVPKCGDRHVWYFQGFCWRNSWGRYVADLQKCSDLINRLFIFLLLSTVSCIKLDCLCLYSIGCLWEVGRYTTTSAQAYEGSSEETEKPRSDSQHQAQAHSLSLRHQHFVQEWQSAIEEWCHRVENLFMKPL